MADFSVQHQDYNQAIISTMSLESCGIEAGAVAQVPGALAWPTTNKAIFVPFVVSQPFVAQKMFVEIGAASGNIDVGLYDSQKNRLVSMGSTAQAGTNALQTFDITDTTLNPGQYYMAVAADNTTGTVFRTATTQAAMSSAWGVLEQTSAFPLPDPAVWVQITTSYIPFVAVAGRSTV